MIELGWCKRWSGVIEVSVVMMCGIVWRHMVFLFFFFNDTATTEIYTLSLHDALPISQAHNDGTEIKVKRSDFGLTWKDMPKATW